EPSSLGPHRLVGRARDPDLVVAGRDDALQHLVDDLPDVERAAGIGIAQRMQAEVEKRAHRLRCIQPERVLQPSHVRGRWHAPCLPGGGAAGWLATSPKRRETVADEKPDIARLIDEAAKAIGLPIAPEYRANVILNYERSLAIARPLLEVELDDELTSAPVFRP